VQVADSTGSRILDVPEDLKNPPPDPPPADLMVTAYDHLHAGGFDLGPYTKLLSLMRNQILGMTGPADPAPATFIDGVAGQEVLDAVRQSAKEKRWVNIAQEPTSIQ
jgi:predicted dehydrogenase